MRCRSRRTSHSRSNQLTQSQSTGVQVGLGGRSSGPFTISAPNLSFGSSCFGIPSSKAHLPMWARFRALAHRQVSGQLYEPTSGGLIELVRFPVAFRPPALGFLGILYPPADISLPHSRPTGQGPAHDGVTTFHTYETRPGWGAPLYPGTAVFTRPVRSLRPAPAASQRPVLPPGYHIPSPMAYVTRHHQGFTHVHPSGLPLTCSGRMVRQPLGVNSELHTPPLPVTHVGAGTGIEHSPGTTPSSEAPFEQSSRHVRPRVARSSRS